MPVRLNVLMVHAPIGDASAQFLGETVVGELIGLPGIDLTLIDRLDQIDPASTDQLTLDSISADIAVLAWQPVAETIRLLTATGFNGKRARHAHDQAADARAQAAADSPRIYGFDLHEFDSVQQLCSALAELLASRQVRTYTLESLISKPASGPAIPDTAKAVELQSSANSPQAPTAETTAADATEPAAAGRGPSRQPLDLDHLVDQLDQLDP